MRMKDVRARNYLAPPTGSETCSNETKRRRVGQRGTKEEIGEGRREGEKCSSRLCPKPRQIQWIAATYSLLLSLPPWMYVHFIRLAEDRRKAWPTFLHIAVIWGITCVKTSSHR